VGDVQLENDVISKNKKYMTLLRSRLPKILGSILSKDKRFFFLHNAKVCPGPHYAISHLISEAFYLWFEADGRE
jgi:hypothetical protein